MLLITNTDRRTTECSTSDSLDNISWVQNDTSLLYSPGMSLHMTQFYQAFPRVSTASNKRWSEKAWGLGQTHLSV